MPLSRTKRFRPYGDAGVGLVGYVPGPGKKDALAQGVALHDNWEFLFNWGGGLKYLLSDEVAFVADGKDRISRVPSYGLPDTARVVNGRFIPGMNRHGFINNWQINVGFTYL